MQSPSLSACYYSSAAIFTSAERINIHPERTDEIEKEKGKKREEKGKNGKYRTKSLLIFM